ncbi:hypothetical protein [Methylobacterium sp. JK268]
MTQRSDTAFDPYGETLSSVPSCAGAAGDRRARRAAIGLFWALALLLVAGRVYVSAEPHTGLLAQAAAAVSSVIR